MIHFTADTHFHHEGALRFRHFETVEEMNQTIIRNWNSKVARGDTVYHLGDFGFNVAAIPGLVTQLNGQIHLVLGNHDPDWPCNRLKSAGFASIRESKYIKIDGDKFYLQHYPCRAWRSSYHGSYHLYGHSHGHMPPLNRSMDVGVDCWDYSPVSLPVVLSELSHKPTTNHHSAKKEA